MSDTTSSTADVDWNAVVASDTNQAAPAPRAAAPTNLPPFPQGVAYLIGRLPIKPDTSVAIVQLPEAIKGVSCAAVFVNSGVLSDCYRPAKPSCGVPTALRGQPINDREIRVVLDSDGDGKVTGLGWTPGAYQGSMPTTRSVEVGVPYVEVLLFVGVECGCNSENWAPDNEWGQ